MIAFIIIMTAHIIDLRKRWWWTRVFFTGFNSIHFCTKRISHTFAVSLEGGLFYIFYKSVYLCAIMTSPYQWMKPHPKHQSVTIHFIKLSKSQRSSSKNSGLRLVIISNWLRLWKIPIKNYDLICWTYGDIVIIIYYLDVSDIPTLTNFETHTITVPK